EVRPRHRLPRHPTGSRGAEGAATPRREAPLTPQEPQGGGTGGGRDPRLRGDAPGWPPGRSDARDRHRGRLDPTVPEGPPRDGPDGGRLQEPGLARDDRGGRARVEGSGQRDFSALDLLAVWIDGVQLGSYHVIGAAGVDDQGKKHLLGLREGATENAE